MFKPTVVAVPLLTLFLVACGGSDSGESVTGNNTGSTGSTGSTGNNNNTGGSQTPAAPRLPALGSSSGTAYRDKRVELSLEQVLVGGESVVTVTAVDKNAANAPLTDNYRFVFSSTCQAAGNAEFSISETVAAGTVASTYRNKNCTSGDAISVQLYAVGSSSVVATATGSITTSNPNLGNGEGVNYIDNKVAGRLTLQGETETELTATAVNPLKANEKISGSNYRVRWASSCADASFSVTEQDLSSDVSTKYRLNSTTSCLGANNLTLQLFEKNNASNILDTVNFTVTVERGVDAKIGIGSGGSFDGGKLQRSDGSISASGSALFSVNIVDGNSTPANQIVRNRSYGVAIQSTCSNQLPAQAEFAENEKVVAQGENVRFRYTAKGCVGTDNITAILYAVANGQIDKTSELGRAVATIDVDPQEIGAISFEGADRTLIAIKGLGNSSLPTQTAVNFKVVDKSQNPVEGRVVEFLLSNKTGGVELAAPSGVTNAAGEVKAIVNSGTTHTQVAVKATVKKVGSEPEISPTNSLPISITTGLADQNSFEIVAEVLNPNAARSSGTTVKITAFAADQFNNPVPDGVTVNFTAESGNIQSRCTMSGGNCSVNWVSSGDRPGMTEPVLELKNETRTDWSDTRYKVGRDTHFGMTTILAYMEGEAGFTDGNNNGLFDTGEAMFSVAEPVRDDNSNGGSPESDSSGNVVEFFADYDDDGQWDNAPGFYQGALCSADSKDASKGGNPLNCSQLAFINSSLRIVQSDGNSPFVMKIYVQAPGQAIQKIYDERATPNPIKINLPTLTANQTADLYVLVQDANGNIPPSGTTLSVAGDGYEIASPSATARNSRGGLSSTEQTRVLGESKFGMFHAATFTPDGALKNIKVTATFGSNTKEVTLQRP